MSVSIRTRLVLTCIIVACLAGCLGPSTGGKATGGQTFTIDSFPAGVDTNGTEWKYLLGVFVTWKDGTQFEESKRYVEVQILNRDRQIIFKDEITFQQARSVYPEVIWSRADRLQITFKDTAGPMADGTEKTKDRVIGFASYSEVDGKYAKDKG